MSSTIGTLTHVMGYWSCRHFNPKKWVIATHLFLQCSVRSGVSPVGHGNGISCSSGQGLQFLSECGSLPVLDRSVLETGLRC